MNPLSQALKNGHYPKRMVVSRRQVSYILKCFQTKWEPAKVAPTEAYCTAYYMTKTGQQKKCLIVWDTRE